MFCPSMPQRSLKQRVSISNLIGSSLPSPMWNSPATGFRSIERQRKKKKRPSFWLHSVGFHFFSENGRHGSDIRWCSLGVRVCTVLIIWMAWADRKVLSLIGPYPLAIVTAWFYPGGISAASMEHGMDDVISFGATLNLETIWIHAIFPPITCCVTFWALRAGGKVSVSWQKGDLCF